MQNMENDSIEKALFEIPDNVEFPIELCHHLRSKLHAVMEQNSFLKRHVTYLDKEVINLRKDRVFRQQKDAESDAKEIKDIINHQQPNIMASKIVQLGKVKRHLTAKLESVRTQCKQLTRENEQLRLQVGQDGMGSSKMSLSESASTTGNQRQPSGDSEVQTSRKLNAMTKKMMEYRRQCQQLHADLKTALRALAQEIGDSANPQTVLRNVGNPLWRGRQQQIAALQQKVAEFQMKADNSQHSLWDEGSHIGDGDSTTGMSRRAGSIMSLASMSTVSVSASTRTTLIEKDMKKQEQIDKLSHDLEKVTQDLKYRRQEVKAGKARIETLESQVRSLRSQIELLEIKVQEKQYDNKDVLHEMKLLKFELATTHQREKQWKSRTSSEVEEMRRALHRERDIVNKLQDVINEKQAALQVAEVEVAELRSKLEGWYSASVDCV